jgi:hypothetical protein
MELRKLKALLAALRDAGVTSYRDADVTLQLGGTLVQVPDGDVEDESGELKLPPGVPDPRAAILAVYEKAKRVGRAS